VTVRAARRIPDLEPGSDEWMRLMTASKVSAVLGLSPWESRFSLWHRMAGQLEAKPDTNATRRGHYLEDAVATWLGDQYPDLRFGRTGSWVNKARPWQSATPDRIARAGRKALAVAEIKTAADYEEWGPDGSDQIPPHYRAQVVWQMDCLGLPTAYVAVLLPRLQFRAYAIHYDQGEVHFIRQQVRAFLDSLPGGPAEQVPDIDDHDQTYVAVRQLHPDIEDREVEVPMPLAAAYCQAVTGLRAAEDEHQLRRAELAQHMGDAKKAVVHTGLDVVHTIASRQAKTGGPPFVKAATKLPDLTQETAA
jgi:putative phage-type endonuclease